MATETPSRVNVLEYSGKQFLLDLDRKERAEFYKLIEESPWEGPTASGHWQVRDLVGHMIDVTEGYLTRWDMARRGDDTAVGLGLPVMAQELDRVALTFRTLPRAEAIARLKAASDRLMTLFDGISADQWGGFNVTHVFMGPLPLFFYPAFQIMDYGVHTWDMRQGLGQTDAVVDERAAGVLVPYMFVLMQYTVDQESAKGVDITYGIVVDGEWGGKWRVQVKDGQFTSEPVSDVSDLPATLHFKTASEFVLTAFQRYEGGEASGDPAVIEKARHLYFRI